jgi:septum formation protein
VGEAGEDMSDETTATSAVNGPEAPLRSEGYFALVLLEESSRALREQFATLPQPAAHHCTVRFGSRDPADLPEAFTAADLGRVFTLKVIGWKTRQDGGIQAVAVALVGEGGALVTKGLSVNKVPHITVATDGVVSAAASNALLEEGFMRVDGPELKATLEHRVKQRMDLILASTSRYRRELLFRLGLPFRWRAPGVDEEALKVSAISPRELSARLALAKATRVLAEEPGATVIAGDQVVALGGQVLGKPGGREKAIEQLLQMTGETHELYTAMVVAHGERVYPHMDMATLRMRALSRGEIERYVDADEPFDCAGAYKLEARGILLFERIEAEDHSAITGLPLIALTTILRGLGVTLP